MSELYEIRLQGHLDGDWSDWFDGTMVTYHAGGSTVLVGAIRDQAALHGLLARVRDLAIPLLLVKRVVTSDSQQG